MPGDRSSHEHSVREGESRRILLYGRGPLDGFNPAAAEAVNWTRKQLSEDDRQWLRELKYVRMVTNFTIVHATLDGPQRWGYVFDKLAAAASFTYQNTAICFFGHTHVPVAFMRDSMVRVGPIQNSRSRLGRSTS